MICFFILQTLYGWISNATSFIASGYSAYSFIGLYLLGRFIKVHRPSITKFANCKNTFIFVILTLVVVCMIIVGVYIGNNAVIARALAYSNPFVIAQAVFALMIFLNFRISSKTINWIGKSCFAVFLGHFMIFKYVQYIALMFTQVYSGIMAVGTITLLALGFFFMCILVDKVRLFLWAKLINVLSSTYHISNHV